MSWRQFIMGPGRQDAIERRLRWEQEEQEEESRKEQQKRRQRSVERARQQESSDRAEERNREDAERSARVNANTQSQKTTETSLDYTGTNIKSDESKSINRPKDVMSREEYLKANDIPLTTADHSNGPWYQRAANWLGQYADQFREQQKDVHASSNWWISKPFIWFSDFVGGAISGAIEGARDYANYRAQIAEDKKRKEFLSNFTQQAYKNARAEALSPKNAIQDYGYDPEDPMFGLDEQQQESIAKREQEYRDLIGPSNETLSIYQEQAEEFLNQQAPNRPSNYGKPRFTRDRYGRLNGIDMPWLNDFWTQAMENMNEVQRDAFGGMQIRFNEKALRADNASKYYSAQQDSERIPRWNNLLDKFSKDPTALNEYERASVEELIQKPYDTILNVDVAQKKSELQQRMLQVPVELNRYKRDAEFMESYDPEFHWSWNPISLVTRAARSTSVGFDRLMSKGLEDWWNLGWTSSITDDVEALDAELKGLKTASLDRKQQILQQYKNEGVRKSQYWKRGVEENEKDLQEWKDHHQVSDYFKFKMEHSDGSFYKADTWLYKNANLWGSSQSSWIKQMTSLGLNTMIGLGVGGGSMAATGSIGGTSAVLGYSSSADETNAEVIQNYRERLKQQLKNKGLTREFLKSAPRNVKDNLDDAVTEYTLRPWELGNRQVQEVAFESMHGANSLYEDGIMAVFGGEMVDMYLQISPFARYARASKPSSIINTATKAGSYTSVISPVVGAATTAGTAVTKATKQALSKTAIGQSISKQTRKFVDFSKKIPERLLGEQRYKSYLAKVKSTSDNVFGYNSMPHRVLTAENYVKYQAIKDYGKDVASSIIHASINEGIEEGKQYLLGKKFISGEYDNDVHKTLLDAGRMYNDMETGIQSAIAMSTLLPFMPALVKDEELIENIKGGMLGGMFQTGMQRSIFGLIPAAQQVKMQDFVANEITLEKQAQMDDYQKAKLYAKKASDNAAAGRMMLAFERYAEAAQNEIDRGVDGASQDLVDQIKAQQKIASSVISIANNHSVQNRAKSLGISPNTDKYYQYVAAINMFDQSKKEAEIRKEDAIKHTNEVLAKTNNPYSIDEDTGEVVLNTVLDGGVRMQQAIKPINDSNGNPLKGQELLDAAVSNRNRNIRIFARISQLKSLQQYLTEALANDDLSNQTRKDFKFQLNRVNRYLRAQLLNIKDEERERVENEASNYLSYLDNSEEILQAVHSEIMSELDTDYHDAMLKGLLGDLMDFAGGTSDMLEDFVHSGYKHPESVIDDIENTITSDYKLANNIEQDWLYQYDLADDRVLDQREKYRRAQREHNQKLEAQRIQQDIEDSELEDTNEAVDSDDLIDLAGAYDAVLQQEEYSEDEFDVPLVDQEQHPVQIGNKRMSAKDMADIRKQAADKVKAKAKRSKKLIGRSTTQATTDDSNKRKKYISPTSILNNTPQEVLDVFAGLEEVLQKLANIPEIDIIDVREETAWQAKLLEDRINQWMLNVLATQRFGSAVLADAQMFEIDAQTIFDTISSEIWVSNFGVYRDLINFSDVKTLQRKNYFDEDVERALLNDYLKYENDVRSTLHILTSELYKIGGEIKNNGLHIQNGLLDSPTATRVDEIIATLDRLIDDAAEVGIMFSDKTLKEYNRAKQWFANNEGLTGRKSEPTIVQKPKQYPPVIDVNSTNVVGYLNSSEYGHGINQSVAEDGTKLTDVINMPDFITNGLFTLIVTTHKQKASTVKKVSIVVEYGGKKFSPVTLDSQLMQKTPQGKDFYFAVLKAYNTNAIGEGQILIPNKVVRSTGVQHHSNKFDTALNKGIISIEHKEGITNLYDIDFTPQQRTFGLSSARQTTSGAYSTCVVAPDGTVLYRFNGDRNFSGAVFMMLNREYDEHDPINKPKIPILFRAKKLSEGDANLIVDILTGKYNPNGITGRAALSEYVYINGENSGLTGLDIIKVLIPQTGSKDLYSSRVHFDIAAGSSQLQIIGRVKGDDQSMDPIVRTFDLSTQTGIQNFVQFAKDNIEIAIDKQFMSQRFGYNNHTTDFPFHNLFLTQAMTSRLNAGEQIRFGNSSITLDSSDIINPNDSNDQRGLSGLAWMIKNGLLETDFDGVDGVRLGVDTEQGVRIVDRDQQKVAQDLENNTPLTKTQRETGYTDEELAKFFDKAVKDINNGKKIDEVEARKHLARILGRDFAEHNVFVQDAIIDTAINGRVVGRCYHDSIVLSRQAEPGVEYHEAFHRILEIVAPKKLRSMVYKAYRNKKDGAKTKSDSEIAELLADEFMYFVMNQPTFKLPHSLKEAFQMIKDYVGFVRKIGSFRLYLMYTFTNNGAISKIFHVSKDRQEAFKKIQSNGMNKVIRGKEFDKIINSAMYRDLKNSLIYLIFKSKTIDIAGRNIQDLDIEKEFVENSSIYEQWMNDENVPVATKEALRQIVENWEYVKPDIAAMISKFTTDYRVQYEEENDDAKNGDEESIAGAAIGDHTRSSYEFSQFSRTTSRVKFFFAVIPDRKWVIDGSKHVPKMQLNKVGLPQLASANELFNIVLNKLHSCQTYEELLEGLKNLGYDDARIYHVYKNIKTIYDRVKQGRGSAEEEGILTQIKTIIHSAKNEFMLAKSSKLGNMYTIQMQSTDAEYNARQYVMNWQQLLESGTNSYITRNADGEYVMKAPYRASVFGRISQIIEQWAVDVTNPATDHNHLKYRIVSMLNSLGIQFDEEALNYMLRHKYGSSDLVGLQKIFSDPTFNIIGLANSLRTLYDAAGNIIQRNIPELFENIGFVKELANWKYWYRHAHDQLTVLAANNNKYYVISENNYITDQTDHLNRKDKEFDELCGFNYNLFEVADPLQVGSRRTIGSVVLKYLSKEGYVNPLNLVTFAGFKTDEPGDVGQDYATIAKRDDYIAKASMLQQGALIFPTMSDKKTWTFLTGVPMPGLKFERIRVNGQTIMVCNVNIASGNIISQDIIDQMWEYAMCERKAIVETLDVVRGRETPNGKIPPLAEEKKVANYHKATVTVNDKEYQIIQGARFSSLLGVWNGNEFVEFNRVTDKNGKYLSEEDNLKIADKYFFNQPVEVQKQLILENLKRQIQKELDYVESLGLITKDTKTGLYKNIGLDQAYLDAITASLVGSGKITDIAQSVAIIMSVADICCKSIISLQETERLYSGHPSTHVWRYDNRTGSLIDRSVDQHKRLGGLVSTGTNNDLELNGIPEEYVCAEVDNDEPPADNLDELYAKMEEGEIRASYLHSVLDDYHVGFEDQILAEQIAEEVDAMSLDEIKEKVGDGAYQLLKAKGSAKAKVFSKIDVADGAAYISDKMTENLLRMVGSWNDEIETAFKILRGEPVNGRIYTTKDIRTLSEAYRLVSTTVIGNQKYTAYGLRKEAGALIPYYDKMALFPMFKCMCTGHMADMYELMKEQGVDMVMINSSVKTGSMGSTRMTWDKNFKFNSYRQKYSQIRKQFNTDPKEAKDMKVGTQSAKIAMSAIIPGRKYQINGKEESSTQMRNAIMIDQQELAKLGLNELEDELFDTSTNEDGTVTSKSLNIAKFSEMLTRELTDRGSSSEMLDAVSMNNGKMKLPLAAMSNLGWIQSIIASIVNKRIVDIRTPGYAYIQRSVWGMEKTSIISDENIPPSLYGGKPLKMINENGSMDCVLSIDFFEKIIPKIPKRDEDGHIIYQVDEDGHFVLNKDNNRKPVMENMPFEQARQWLIDNGMIGGEPTIFGYRIPTQAISSIHALRCVDVLPVVRDTVVLPAEFTRITGADFDIDKLFLSTYFWKKGEDGKMTTEFEKGSKEYYANDLIRRYLTLLTDLDEDGKSRNTHLQHASIDGDTKLLTDIVEDLESDLDKPVIMPYQDYTLSQQVITKDAFITGKFGIGPFALNNNSQILTTLYGIEFNPFYNGKETILSKLGLTSLHRYTDRDGNPIMSWLSGLINAHVDVAKDPYITRLGVNKYTYNLTNLLIRTGLGKTTFYMLTQPIMKSLSEAYNTASGSYMKQSGVSQIKAQNDAVNQVILNEFQKIGISSQLDDSVKSEQKVEDCINKFRAYFFNTYRTSPINVIEELFSTDNNILHKISKHGIQNGFYEIYIDGKKRNLTGTDIQLLVIMAKRMFDPYAQALSDFVKYSKIDTSKQGKNVQEQREYLLGYHRIFDIDSESFSRKCFKTEGLDRMATDSYVGVKTLTATSAFMRILEGQLIEATNSFSKDLDVLLSKIDEEERTSKKTINTLTRKMLIKIKSDYFSMVYCPMFGIDIKGLVSGSNTIYDRLNKIKSAILSDPKYQELVDAQGEISNYLLRSLTLSYEYQYNQKINPAAGNRPDTYPTAKFIKLFNFTEEDTIDQDSIIEAWEELLNDGKFPELQEFARDLIAYAFITSGDSGSMTDLFKYVPNSWKLDPMGQGYDASYAKYIEMQLDEYNAAPYGLLDNDAIDDILQNSWYDDEIIPTIKDISKFHTVTLSGQTHPSILISYQSIDDMPYMFKVKRPNAQGNNNYSQRRYSLYKKVTVGNREVFVEVDPKGMKFPNGHYIYEMSRQDNKYADVVISLLTDPNMLAMARQFGLSTDSIEEFLNDLVIKLTYTSNQDMSSQLAQMGILPQEIDAFVGSIIGRDLQERHRQIEERLQQQLEQPDFDPSTAEFYSGAARGSDKEWARLARMYGIKVKEYTSQSYDDLPQEWKDRLYQEYIGVIEELGYNEASDEENKKLLIRDMMQADKADAVFAIGQYDGSKISGGTLYAVTRAWQRGIPVYVFDQDSKQWYNYDTGDEIDTPTLTQHAAVIGTRELSESGKQAMQNVFTKTLSPRAAAPNTRPVPPPSSSTFSTFSSNFDVNSISDKSAAYGVEIVQGGSTGLKNSYVAWQQQHPDGIVAYRVNFNSYNTPAEVLAGRIGNPFSENSFDKNTVQQFYDWIVTGNNFENPKATEEYRQAIIQKILNTAENTPILYYTELNRPSHATVIGYLINNKQLLSQQSRNSTNAQNTSLEPTQPALNVHFTAGQNPEFSNFAYRPFSMKSITINGQYINFGGMEFDNVEQAFQFAKVFFIDDPNIADKEYHRLVYKLSSESKTPEDSAGTIAKQLGRSVQGLNKQKWDAASAEVMLQIMRASFEQNQDAMTALVNTGNVEITHNPFGGPFASNIMKLRNEFREQLKYGRLREFFETFTTDTKTEDQLDEFRDYFEQLSKSGTHTTSEILNYIASHTADKRVAALVKILQKALRESINVTFHQSLPDGNFGQYVYEGGEEILISIQSPSFTHTFLHECVHAITAAAIEADQDLYDKLRYVQQYAAKQMEEAGWGPEFIELFGLSYGAYTNPLEFVSEAMSNRLFQQVLAHMKPIEKQQFDNLFDQFIHFVKECIKRVIPLRQHDSVKSLWDQIDPILQNIINVQYADREDLINRAISKRSELGNAIDSMNYGAFSTNEREQDYNLTKRIKNFIYSRVASLDYDRMIRNQSNINVQLDITVSKQTFSKGNGKYIIIKKASDNITNKEFEKLYNDIQEHGSDFGIHVIKRGNQILVISNQYNIDNIDEMIGEFNPVSYYKSIISGESDSSAIAILEQELKDVDTHEEELAILGLIQEIKCKYI